MNRFHRLVPKKNKYHAIPTEIDNMRFDSRLEAQYYAVLKRLVKVGEVGYFLRQVPFHLPGKVTYRCDFQVFWKSGEITYVDVKGRDTPMSRLKRKQVEEIYPVSIELVSKVGQ